MTLVLYRPDEFFLITHPFYLNDSVLTILCLNPAPVFASCANEGKNCIQEIDFYQSCGWGNTWLICVINQECLPNAWQDVFRISGLRFSMQIFVKRSRRLLLHKSGLENLMSNWKILLEIWSKGIENLLPALFFTVLMSNRVNSFYLIIDWFAVCVSDSKDSVQC